MDGFQKLIGQIGIFVICAQAILHFRPRESYHKYLRLLLGVMVLVQITQPFLESFFDVSGEDIQSSMTGFQKQLESSRNDYDELAQQAGKKLEEMTKRVALEAAEKNELGDRQEVTETNRKIDIRIEPIQIGTDENGGVP